jgi:hypothetical protein
VRSTEQLPHGKNLIEHLEKRRGMALLNCNVPAEQVAMRIMAKEKEFVHLRFLS